MLRHDDTQGMPPISKNLISGCQNVQNRQIFRPKYLKNSVCCEEWTEFCQARILVSNGRHEKGQGQSMLRVGVYVAQQMFAHGQLYVAVSRAVLAAGLKLFIEGGKDQLKNIVYQEIL